MGKLEGKRAVVTGAGRGIGAAVARDLIAEGARVVLAARTQGEIEKLAEELGEAAFPVVCDVAEEGSILQMAAAARERFGKIDILVNNAGIATSSPVKTLTLADWNRVYAINATGTFLCTRAFLPDMLESGWGRVINVASVASRAGIRYTAAYSASKHAVLGFTRSLADEVARSGVTVNAICPGFVDTDMTRQSVERIQRQTGRSEDESREALVRLNPQGRLIEADEVAYLVLCLCDHRARGVNGQALVVDGGGLLA